MRTSDNCCGKSSPPIDGSPGASGGVDAADGAAVVVGELACRVEGSKFAAGGEEAGAGAATGCAVDAAFDTGTLGAGADGCMADAGGAGVFDGGVATVGAKDSVGAGGVVLPCA